MYERWSLLRAYYPVDSGEFRVLYRLIEGLGVGQVFGVYVMGDAISSNVVLATDVGIVDAHVRTDHVRGDDEVAQQGPVHLRGDASLTPWVDVRGIELTTTSILLSEGEPVVETRLVVQDPRISLVGTGRSNVAEFGRALIDGQRRYR